MSVLIMSRQTKRAYLKLCHEKRQKKKKKNFNTNGLKLHTYQNSLIIKLEDAQIIH